MIFCKNKLKIKKMAVKEQFSTSEVHKNIQFFPVNELQQIFKQMQSEFSQDNIDTL